MKIFEIFFVISPELLSCEAIHWDHRMVRISSEWAFHQLRPRANHKRFSQFFLGVFAKNLPKIVDFAIFSIRIVGAGDQRSIGIIHPKYPEYINPSVTDSNHSGRCGTWFWTLVEEKRMFWPNRPYLVRSNTNPGGQPQWRFPSLTGAYSELFWD